MVFIKGDSIKSNLFEMECKEKEVEIDLVLDEENDIKMGEISRICNMTKEELVNGMLNYIFVNDDVRAEVVAAIQLEH